MIDFLKIYFKKMVGFRTSFIFLNPIIYLFFITIIYSLDTLGFEGEFNELPIIVQQCELKNPEKSNIENINNIKFIKCCDLLKEEKYIDLSVPNDVQKNQCRLLIDEPHPIQTQFDHTISCSRTAYFAAIENLKDLFEFSPELIKMIYTGELGRLLGSELFDLTHGEKTIFEKVRQAFEKKYATVMTCLSFSQRRDFFCKNLPTALSLLIPIEYINMATKVGKTLKLLKPLDTNVVKKMTFEETHKIMHENLMHINLDNNIKQEKILNSRISGNWKKKEQDAITIPDSQFVSFAPHAESLDKIYLKYVDGVPGNEKSTKVNFTEISTSKDPQQIKLYNSAMQDVAKTYENIYKEAGFKVKLHPPQMSHGKIIDSYELELVGISENSSNLNSKKLAKMLANTKDKLDINSIVINIDKSFFNPIQHESGHYNVAAKKITMNSFGAQNPEILLQNNDIFFHEVRHALNEELRVQGKEKLVNNILIVDTANYPIGAPHNLVSLNNYEDLFFTEEWDTYKKQFAIAKKAPIALPNFNYSNAEVLKIKRLSHIAISYQEAARSAYLNAEYAENYLKHGGPTQFAFQQSLTKNPSHSNLASANSEMAIVNIALADKEMETSYGIMELTLHNISKNDSPAKQAAILKDYVFRMKIQAQKEFENAQRILGELSDASIPIDKIKASSQREPSQ